ncbi:DUF3570 domain-containing protein [OM182 bacterium]|nr:DUF3570 domain-containing protein [OM182 bacterium]
MTKRYSKSLLALSSTALTLSSLSHADAPPPQSTASIKSTNYQEDDLLSNEVLFGELSRYDIDVHQFQLITPVSRNSSLQINGSYDSLSGASPWFTSADAEGEPIVNLSGASGIYDERRELSVGGSYYFENDTLSANAGRSAENDYTATFVSIGLAHELRNKLTTISLNASVSNDDIFPTDANKFNRIERASKRSVSTALSVSHIINRFSTYQTAISVTNQKGFLSDPYKLRDIRPDTKSQYAWTNSFRLFLDEADAALHLNYRLYHDDFGIGSHTVDFAWHQNLTTSLPIDLRIVPSIRYYTQSSANFFTNIDDFSSNPLTPQSSDYRLAAFGAISGGINIIANINSWRITLGAERYQAKSKYSSYNVSKPSTALVRFSRFSLGFDFSY